MTSRSRIALMAADHEDDVRPTTKTDRPWRRPRRRRERRRGHGRTGDKHGADLHLRRRRARPKSGCHEEGHYDAGMKITVEVT